MNTDQLIGSRRLSRRVACCSQSVLIRGIRGQSFRFRQLEMRWPL